MSKNTKTYRLMIPVGWKIITINVEIDFDFILKAVAVALTLNLLIKYLSQ